MCPSIRAASTTAAALAAPFARSNNRVHQSEPRRLLRQQPTPQRQRSEPVSINQSRVDYCGQMLVDRMDDLIGVHQSEPRRLLRLRNFFGFPIRDLVSINQSRVDYCGPAYPKLLKPQHLCTRFRACVPRAGVGVGESRLRTAIGAISSSRAANFGTASVPGTPSRHHRARGDQHRRRNSRHVKERAL